MSQDVKETLSRHLHTPCSPTTLTGQTHHKEVHEDKSSHKEKVLQAFSKNTLRIVIDPPSPIIFSSHRQEHFHFHTHLLRQFQQHNGLNLPVHLTRRQYFSPHSQQVPLNTYTKQSLVLLQVRPHQPPISLSKLSQLPTIQLITRQQTMRIPNIQRSTRRQREQITTWIR